MKNTYSTPTIREISLSSLVETLLEERIERLSIINIARVSLDDAVKDLTTLDASVNQLLSFLKENDKQEHVNNFLTGVKNNGQQ